MSKANKKWIMAFGIAFGVIFFAMVFLLVDVYRFHKQDRELQFSVTNMEEEYTDQECTVAIMPRGGSTDTWIKGILEEDDFGEIQRTQYAGIIYEATVTNRTDISISDWTLEVPITQDCFLNNAWCGQLEIHQNTAGQEKVQVLDLRRCLEDNIDIVLDYTIEGTDLMIPVYAGDYFVYLPSVADSEDVILSSNPEMGIYQDKRVDFIAYHMIETGNLTPMEFPGAVLHYHLQKELIKMASFWILMGLFLIWCIFVVTAFIVYRQTRFLIEQAERDAQTIEQTMSAFIGFIDAKDTSTNGHSKRVAEYTRKIAEKLGFDEKECTRMYYIGLMHDCGKIGIPDAVLCKNSSLTDEEYELIKTHTVQGNKILQDFTAVEGIRDGSLYHHERYDGKGYPTGRKGEDIPLIARIIGVADAFDAMNSDRCYRSRLSSEEIIHQLKSNSGTQFDPKLVECLLAMLDDGTIQF